MKKLLMALLFLTTSLFAQSGGVPVITTIPLSAWKLGAGSTITTAPDGSQVIEIGYGSSASVDLGVTPAQLQALNGVPYVREGIYSLTFEVQNNLPKYPGYYQLEVDFGTQELCPAAGWGKIDFSTVTTVCPGPGYIVIDKSLNCDQNPCTSGPVQGSQNFVIHATDPGWPVYIKQASLTFTPSN